MCCLDFSLTFGTLFAWHELRAAMAASIRGLRVGGDGCD